MAYRYSALDPILDELVRETPAPAKVPMASRISGILHHRLNEQRTQHELTEREPGTVHALPERVRQPSISVVIFSLRPD